MFSFEVVGVRVSSRGFEVSGSRKETTYFPILVDDARFFWIVSKRERAELTSRILQSQCFEWLNLQQPGCVMVQRLDSDLPDPVWRFFVLNGNAYRPNLVSLEIKTRANTQLSVVNLPLTGPKPPGHDF